MGDPGNFAEFVGWQNDRHHASRFAFLWAAHLWAPNFGRLDFPPFCPFRPFCPFLPFCRSHRLPLSKL